MGDIGVKWFAITNSKMLSLGKGIYVGEFWHNLDAKNRLTIPSKWRYTDDQKDLYLALPNPVGCVTVYPPNMVSKLEEKVSQVSLGDKQGQRALTRLFSKADTFSCDKQGRINLNDKLIAHAKIGKEVVLVGNFVTFHMWEPKAYESYLERGSEEEDEMTQILKELGL